MENIAIVCTEKEVIELAASCPNVNVAGIFDLNPEADVLSFPLLGRDEDWEEVRKRLPDLKVVIAVDLPKLKEKLVSHYGLDSLASLVAPDAFISASASMHVGHLVQRGAKILAKAKIGVCCKINTDVTVHHDCVVGDYCTLAPGSRLLGGVKLGQCVFVGAGAVVLPKVSVGSDCIIGAGAVVVSNVRAGTTVVGVPAKPVLKSKYLA